MTFLFLLFALTDESNLLKPRWLDGGIDIDRMAALRSLYARLRATTACHTAFSLLVRTVLAQTDRQLRHFCLALLYNVLEPGYLADSCHNNNNSCNVDISIKQLLTCDDTTTDFYGTLNPYFDPVRWLIDRLPVGLKTIVFETYRRINSWLPERFKYLFYVVTGMLTAASSHPKDLNTGSPLPLLHRRRIELEDKAKVIASDWGTESLPR